MNGSRYQLKQMKILRFILQKEFRQIFRDKSILSMMFVMPVIQLIIMPMAADFEVKNVNVAFVDHDHSSYSLDLKNKIASSGYFRMVGHPNSFAEGVEMIEYGKADLVLEIPVGFEKNLMRENIQKVNLSVDAINGTKSSLGGAYLNRVLTDFNNSLDVNVTLTDDITSGPMAQISVVDKTWYNPHAEYKYFMVPGILVLLLTLIGGFVTALNIVKEKEIGTIEQINVTPIKKWQFILGKLIPFWVVGMIVFSLGLIVMRVVYGIFPAGNLGVLYLFAGVYLVALLGLGLLISTFANNQIQAMFIAYFFMVIFILMSGLFTSTDAMPGWAKAISDLIPVTHFVSVIRLIILKGSEFASVRAEFLYLIAFAVGLNGLAIWNYRKTT